MTEAGKFIDEAEHELRDVWVENERASWVNATYITDDTDWLVARATERSMASVARLMKAARRFAPLALTPDLARKYYLLGIMTSLPAPSDGEARRELADISTDLNSAYGKGKGCLDGDKECLDLQALSEIMASSRDYDRLLKAWKAWHQVARPMRAKYQRFVELANQGAQEIAFNDVGVLWRARYDMTPAQFEAEENRLWQQVRPLYEQLHCYVRRKLGATYGQDKVPGGKPIPAHLLGNMWAQDWSNIYPLVEAYAGEASLDVTAQLKAQSYDAVRMAKTGEAFFTSLGLRALPETFWSRSMLTKPPAREVVCHASAWDVDMRGDVRIKMCIDPTEEDLVTIHHELGHDYYFMAYDNLSPLLQQGANDGFHEGIGDTLALSITPSYLKQLGLLDKVPDNPKAELNVLLKRALAKVAFLPFGMLIDQWRWEVFDGRISASDYNAGWWKLRTEYQGIAAPLARSEVDFDPGAKYHIPANVPYARYFLAHILQFQFHKALCAAAGYSGPLHKCSIFGSKLAGAKLQAMLELGASKPWPEALEAVTGPRTMDASALLEYFAPLGEFLATQNAGQTCGW